MTYDPKSDEKMDEETNVRRDQAIRETPGTPEAREPMAPKAPPTTTTPVVPLTEAPAKPAQVPDASAASRNTKPPVQTPTADRTPRADRAARPDRMDRANRTDTRLLPQDESDKLARRLQDALTTFVDGPRHSVEEAAGVLEEAAERLTKVLAERPRSLRAGWDGGSRSSSEGSDTEGLRLALQSYREMTERLLRV